MRLRRTPYYFRIIGCLLLLDASGLHTQTLLPGIDSRLAAQAAERAGISAPGLAQPVPVEKSASYARVNAKPIWVATIRVDGAPNVPSPLLIQAVSPFTGRILTQAGLEDLLGAVSRVARMQGYLFARSAIPPQAVVAGVLRVYLDEGQ